MALTLNHIAHPPAGSETAPPLLIAHGLFGSSRNFNSLARAFTSGRRVVMVDMRNHGGSPWSDAHDYPAMAEDLADAVDRLCGGRAVVLGHSMGGKAAMALALTHPGRVAGLIVADIAPVAYSHSHSGFIAAMQAVDLAAVSRRSDAEPALVAGIPEAPLRAFLLQNLVIENGQAQWRINLAALDANMAAMTGFPEALLEQQYAGPSLFLHGGQSDYVAAESHDVIGALFPAAEIAAIPGAGHWLHAERPKEFAAAVRDWLGKLPG